MPDLDDCYVLVNRTYWSRNFYRDPFSIFGHLVEILGGLTVLTTGKSKPDVDPGPFIAKALAWWMALCGKVGIASVGDMVWSKFPYLCPYCQQAPHEWDPCVAAKQASSGPDWDALARMSESRSSQRPTSLGGWQRMFNVIYPVGSEEYFTTFARFTEELGELAEALRAFPVEPGYFLSEASDVFAWLMHLENLRHSKEQLTVQRGIPLEENFKALYPGRCKDCGGAYCVCPPILDSTLGRIAHEVPNTAPFKAGGEVLSSSQVREMFARQVTIGDAVVELTPRVVNDLLATSHRVLEVVLQNQALQEQSMMLVMRAAHDIQELAIGQAESQEAIQSLAAAIASLPDHEQGQIVQFLLGLASGTWTEALIRAVSG